MSRDQHMPDLLYNNKSQMELKYNVAKTWGEDEAGHGGHGGGGGHGGAGSEWQQSPRDPPPHYHKEQWHQEPPMMSDRPWLAEPTTSNLYLPGKDYYDPPHYPDHPDMRESDPYLERPPLPRNLNNFRAQEEEDRLYNNAAHPRVAMLKNTNIESELLARRREYGGGGSGGRRVHYSDSSFCAEDYGGYSRRYQSPSPGPRPRQDSGSHHRSRRLQYSDEREDYHNHMDTSRLIEEEAQYNA